MKRIFAAILSAAMLLSLTACDNNNNSSAEPESGAQSGSSENTGALSNPVKFTEDGDIDMEAALSYETDFDALKKSLSEREVDLSKPVSLNAQNNPNTMKVWEYLKSVYGNQIISAQQQMNLTQTYEDKVYYNATGDLPAMKGFDFIFANGSEPNRGFVDAAIEWAQESGGLVTFCWHWNVPRDIDDLSQGRAFYGPEYSESNMKTINFDPKKATTPGTKEYEVIVHDMDLIASYLQEMEAAGITVLWRPFHEASGSWFWWGKQASDAEAIKNGTYDTYHRLWYMMYDRFENYHKLSNLIWVWNGQSKYLTVDPNTYDIAGIDVYPSKEDHSPLVSDYKRLASYTYEGKMLALTETGYIPDPQQCVDEGAMWLFYMPWNGGFIYEPTSYSDLNTSPVTDLYGTPNPNPQRLSNELLQEYFGNPALISWKDLPEMPYGEHNIPQRITTWEYFKNQ